jgi:small-conductance mechanosensitive channel
MIRDGKIRAEMRRRSPDSTTDFRRVYDVLVPDMPEEDQQPLPASEPPSAPAAPTDAPAAITALVDALAAERDERQRLAEALLAATERAARAEADAVYAARERQRADDLAETLIALRASLSAKEREAAELREQLARRRWWKPSTW